MKIKNVNIWELKETHVICIPTNLGWNNATENVMGAGLAKQAKKRYPKLPKHLGMKYHHVQMRFHVGVREKSINEDPPIIRFIMPDGVELAMLPSKKLVKPPYLSWKQKSNIQLIAKGLHRFRSLVENDFFEHMFFAIPLIGAGNGGLSEELVKVTLRRIVGDLPEVTFVQKEM